LALRFVFITRIIVPLKVDFVELNEAFSVVAVANVQLLQLDPGKKEKNMQP
jgi:hypothetical protein